MGGSEAKNEYMHLKSASLSGCWLPIHYHWNQWLGVGNTIKPAAVAAVGSQVLMSLTTST